MLRPILLGAVTALAAWTAHADTFYKDKTITVIISTGSGGNDDLVTRSLVRYMPQFIPGQPNMVAQNMPGGGNVLATNHMYNIAPKDGTMIAVVNKGIPLHQVIDGKGVRYDASKFNWLGSPGAKNAIMLTWHTTGVRTVEDAKRKEVVVGGTGPASDIVMFPTVMNKLLGTKFKIVIGYKSLADIDIAMERGELQSRSGSFASTLIQHPDWIEQKKINVLVQIGLKKEPAISAYAGRDVPLLTDLAKSDEERQVLKLISAPISLGYPFLAPPGIPGDRLAILRKAFDATMKDPSFVAEMNKAKFEMDPMTGEEVAQIVKEIVTASPKVIARTKAAIHVEKGGKTAGD